MSNQHTDIIEVSRLRIGHFIFIDLSWLSHPFPLNSFKIHTLEQIETIRSLGIDRVRYSPERSDPEPEESKSDSTEPRDAPAPGPRPGSVDRSNAMEEQDVESRRRKVLADQQASLKACEREFSSASREFRTVLGSVRTNPGAALEAASSVVGGMAGHMLRAGEICIRLLSEKVGERASHEINVTVVSLLLGEACGFDELALHELGLGALLHDIGKIDLPDRLRYSREHRSAAERQIYQEHVAYGIALARNMGLPPEVQTIIAQHHEHVDGSGYPKRIKNAALSPAARIVALVNHYDNLCNPGNPALAMTPHEALSQIFTLRNERFDAPTVNTLIRMMGVYPPGSVIQLTDDRYALVTSVNAQRPLKPRVIIHDRQVPREDALVVDLADHPEVGIRRSLRPLQLPRATYDYLSPRTRICYFFERSMGTLDEGGAP